jgi:uncharacterized repeat protein (TIGR03803 family)
LNTPRRKGALTIKPGKIPHLKMSSRTLCVVLALAAIAAGLVGTAKAQTEAELYDFSGGADGGAPESNLISDSAGNLYGTTTNGGGHQSIYCSGNGCGTVFRLSRTSSGTWEETVLYAFTGQTDGGNPLGGVVLDSAGNLYGTTSTGSVSAGTVFKLAPPASGGQWQFSVLHSFIFKDGESPYAGLVIDSAGNLYGTTKYGGASNLGTVFKVSPVSGGGWKETVLHSFAGGNDGSGPEAPLVLDAAGNLYGTTVLDGPLGAGTVFKVTPLFSGGGWKKTELHAFSNKGKGGAFPSAGLARDEAGNLFGTTPIGGDSSVSCTAPGSGCGTVFKLSPLASGGWVFHILHTFTGGSDGGEPLAGLTLGASGSLNGATFLGGGSSTGCPNNEGCGVVFKLSPVSGGGWKETVLHAFTDGSDGGNPRGSLILDTEGNLYGTANTGGSQFEGWGLVFEIAP